MKDTMLEGQVKRYIGNKGYGFIEDKDNNTYFFHVTDVVNFDMYTDEILSGNKVKFNVKNTPKGLKAYNIIKE